MKIQGAFGEKKMGGGKVTPKTNEKKKVINFCTVSGGEIGKRGINKSTDQQKKKREKERKVTTGQRKTERIWQKNDGRNFQNSPAKCGKKSRILGAKKVYPSTTTQLIKKEKKILTERG